MTGAGMVLASAVRAAEESHSNQVWTIVVWAIAALAFVVTGIGMRIWR
ncbi:MAG TPA: hypothetical protein VFX70_12250 [Mycobacteriales bacterium]|nr:hypothetical protein [Mycobacteriales bacterium]